MTATPHNGKEEDFQLFMSLLDSDRFYGKFRDGAHKVDVTDLMRRMVKEDMLRFDGTACSPSAVPTPPTTSSPTPKPRSTPPSPTT
jgi:esterase/lipase superfamily enzyme